MRQSKIRTLSTIAFLRNISHTSVLGYMNCVLLELSFLITKHLYVSSAGSSYIVEVCYLKACAAFKLTHFMCTPKHLSACVIYKYFNACWGKQTLIAYLKIIFILKILALIMFYVMICSNNLLNYVIESHIVSVLKGKMAIKIRQVKIK